MKFKPTNLARVSVLAAVIAVGTAAAAAGAIALRLDAHEQASLVDNVGMCKPQVNVDAPSAWWASVRTTVRVMVSSVPSGASARFEFQSGASGASATPSAQKLSVALTPTSACGTATAEFSVSPASSTWNRTAADIRYRIVIDGLPGDSLTVAQTARWTDDTTAWVAGAVDCRPYLLVALRGSGSGWSGPDRNQVEFEVNSYAPDRPESSDHELYDEMRSLFEHLNALSPKSNSLGFISPPSYTALPVSFTQSYFDAMTRTGPAAVAATIRAAAAKCPDSRFVLSGYSQGAYIAHRVAATIDADIAKRVVATVVIGDPARGMDSALERGMPVTRNTVGIFAGASRFKPFADDYTTARAKCLAVSTSCAAPSLKTLATLATTDVQRAAAFTALSGRASGILSIFARGDWVADSLPNARNSLNSGGVFGPALATCAADYAAPRSSGWKNCETAMAAATRDGNAAHSSYSTSNWLDIAAAFVAARL